MGVLLSKLLTPPQGSVPKALLALSSAHQNCTGSHSDLKWNWALQRGSSNLACLTILLRAPTGGFKEVFNTNSCAEVIGTIDTKGSSSRVVSLSSSPGPQLVLCLQEEEQADCSTPWCVTEETPSTPSQAPQWSPAPLPVQTSHSLFRIQSFHSLSL